MKQQTSTVKPSVTQLLSKIFPFDTTMFKESLSAEGLLKRKEKGTVIEGGIADIVNELDYDDVMSNLSLFGKIIHLNAYAIGSGFDPVEHDDPIYTTYMQSVHSFFKENDIQDYNGEVHVECDEYQGISDAYCILNGEPTIIDYKTWGGYKDIYGFTNDIFTKTGRIKSRSSDIKKTSVQLSMYKNAMKNIPADTKLKAIWIHSYGYHVFPLVDDLTLYYDLIDNPIRLGQ